MTQTIRRNGLHRTLVKKLNGEHWADSVFIAIEPLYEINDGGSHLTSAEHFQSARLQHHLRYFFGDTAKIRLVPANDLSGSHNMEGIVPPAYDLDAQLMQQTYELIDELVIQPLRKRLLEKHPALAAYPLPAPLGSLDGAYASSMHCLVNIAVHAASRQNQDSLLQIEQLFKIMPQVGFLGMNVKDAATRRFFFLTA